ncbi:MAG: hypothetical protein LBM93_14645 [Oscillospiraceae bacterium]|jgi:hypothetical protein|nr:hypothetical protein [Oscillospiraceae bacterium]
MKYKTIIYGAGGVGQMLLPCLLSDSDVLFYITTSGGGEYAGYPIKSCDVLLDTDLEFDRIFVAVQKTEYQLQIRELLTTKYKIPSEKICAYEPYLLPIARFEFAKSMGGTSPKEESAAIWLN